MKKKKKKGAGDVNISNNVFTGVQWDGKAIDSINTIARAIYNLTELFRSQNIQIDTMLKVTQDKESHK
jgi:hypothetical protein